MKKTTKYALNWQQTELPKATVNRSALKEELSAFKTALAGARKLLRKPVDPEAVARALAQEAVKTSAIEGVNVDASAVMASICKALGVAHEPKGSSNDARAEGVAQMVLAVRSDWNEPISESLLKRWHKLLLTGCEVKAATGDFRSQAETRPMKPEEVALKAAMLLPQFEAIHPFEDGNGCVGRAIVAKTLAEGLGMPLVPPVSAAIARHLDAYRDGIKKASRSPDWTNWAAFFIPVLTETIDDFAAAAKFIAAKRTYFAKYEASLPERASKVILQMFEDGEEEVRAGISVPKWMRLANVSKRSAERDFSQLSAVGAITPVKGGPLTRYRFTGVFSDVVIDPLNDPLNVAPNGAMGGMNKGIQGWLLRLVLAHPGVRSPYMKIIVGKSTATVKRALAVLVKSGQIEFRGGKKTGGYFVKDGAA